MSKDKISDYSATANSNTDIGGINIDEGCAPSGINDAIRTLMKQLKDWQSGSQDVYIHPAGSASVPSITATGDTNTGLFFPAADTVGITTGGTERARIDSSGNLGLGVTPSAWSAVKAMQIGTAAVYAPTSSQNTTLSANNYYDGSVFKYMTSDYASYYQQFSGQHRWYNAASGTAGNSISFTQAMTLDASGQLGIGTTSPTAKLHVQGNSSISTSDWYASSATIRAQATSGNNTQAAIVLMSRGPTGSPAGASIHSQPAGSDNYRAGLVNTITGDGTGQAYWSVNNFNPTTASTSELCRVTYDGNLLVGDTSTTFTSKTVIKGGGNTLLAWQTGAGASLICRLDNTSGRLTTYNYNGSDVGTVTTNGTTVSYNTSSDYRLKDITGSLTGYKERLSALQPKQGSWKADGSEFRGFIAHEFAESYPASVNGEKDAVDADGNPQYQGMQAGSSEVIADLVAYIKELETRLTALEQA